MSDIEYLSPDVAAVADVQTVYPHLWAQLAALREEVRNVRLLMGDMQVQRDEWHARCTAAEAQRAQTVRDMAQAADDYGRFVHRSGLTVTFAQWCEYRRKNFGQSVLR